jgi:hypothetical protein
MNSNRLTVIHRASTLALMVVALCAHAHAQPEPNFEPPAPGEDAPEPTPNSPARRTEALFAEGAELFKQWRFDEAEQKFREALAYREHPVIFLYLSRTLDKQHRLVESHTTLMQALRRDRALLSPEDVQVADDLQTSLESRLAQIEVSCDVPGAEVSLDGEPWFTAPGRPRRILGAGQHVLIARKPGYFPVTEAVSLIPGKRTRLVLRMTADIVHVERRWQPWQPRTVAGAGVAMSLAGSLLLWQASSDYAAIRHELEKCGESSCSPISIHRNDRAAWKERIGTGALIVGGTALAAGVAGMLLNLPRFRHSEPGRGLEALDIAPMLTGAIASISVRIGF